jgi:hypothetical protein
VEERAAIETVELVVWHVTEDIDRRLSAKGLDDLIRALADGADDLPAQLEPVCPRKLECMQKSKVILARLDHGDCQEVRIGSRLRLLPGSRGFDPGMDHDNVRGFCLGIVRKQALARVVGDADHRRWLFPDRGREHGPSIANGCEGKPFWMVEEENVVNRQQEALPAQQQRPVIAEVHEVCAAGRNWQKELLVEKPAEPQWHHRWPAPPLEATLLGFLHARTDDDELVVGP